MKKIYIMPQTSVTEVAPMNMIAASLEVSEETVNNTEGDAKGLVDGSWNIWDDDWSSEE